MLTSTSTNIKDIKKACKLIWKQRKTEIVYFFVVLILMSITVVEINDTQKQLKITDNQLEVLDEKINNTE